MFSFNPYYYWLVIFTLVKIIKKWQLNLKKFQSLLLLVSYFYMLIYDSLKRDIVIEFQSLLLLVSYFYEKK